jgi:HSP20 family protein
MAMLTPFRDFGRVQQMIDEMTRAFDGRGLAKDEGEAFGWSPAVDVFEDENGVKFSFELAGVDPKDVDVRFENNVLTVKGEKKLEHEEKKDRYHRMERVHGTFSRSFTLPATLDAEKIQADFKNGVLGVLIPKKPEAKPKSIQVKVNAA